MSRFSALFLLLTACPFGSGGGADLGVRGSARLDSLDADQQCAAAEGVSDWLVQVFEASCYAQAQGQGIAASQTGGDFESTCEAAFEACQNNIEIGEEPFECEDVEFNTAGCSATINEVERCMNDSLDALSDFTRNRCNREMSLAELEDQMNSQADLPESCLDLQSTCPGFM